MKVDDKPQSQAVHTYSNKIRKNERRVICKSNSAKIKPLCAVCFHTCQFVFARLLDMPYKVLFTEVQQVRARSSRGKGEDNYQNSCKGREEDNHQKCSISNTKTDIKKTTQIKSIQITSCWFDACTFARTSISQHELKF